MASVIRQPFLHALVLAAVMACAGCSLVGDVGSGALLTDTRTPSERLDELILTLKDVPAVTKKQAHVIADAAERMADARTSFEEARATVGTECRDALRRANRDQLTTTMLHCWANELSGRKAMLASLRTAMLTLQPRTKAMDAAMKASDALVKAIVAIQDGLATDVFQSESQAEQSKKQLLGKYIQPFERADAIVQADMALLGLSPLALELKKTLPATPDDERYVSAIDCMHDTAVALKAVSIATDPGVQAHDALTALQTCTALLDIAQTPATSSGASL